MATIEERENSFAKRELPHNNGTASWRDGYREGLKVGYHFGATEQKAIDHSEEHLNWIIKQHNLWLYEMCHCDNNECCTFKEWIDKAMEK